MLHAGDSPRNRDRPYLLTRSYLSGHWTAFRPDNGCGRHSLEREFGLRTYCGKLKSSIPSSSAVGMLDGPPGPPPLPPLCVLGLDDFILASLRFLYQTRVSKLNCRRPRTMSATPALKGAAFDDGARFDIAGSAANWNAR